MKLADVASQLRRSISRRDTAWAGSTLPRGLQIVFSHKGDHYRLALGREAFYPSDSEIAICAAAFAVPEGTEPRRLAVSTRHPKTARLVNLHVVELTWRELDAPRSAAVIQPTLPAVGSPLP